MKKIASVFIPVFIAAVLLFSGCANSLFKVADPVFNPGAGVYETAQTVEITTRTKKADIRYTTDGTDPSATNGEFYSGPLTVDDTITLKAYAYRDNWQDSGITEAIIGISPPGSRINSFSFLPDSNGSNILSGANGTVNHTSKTISVSLPLGTDLASLVPAFDVPYGSTVKVGSTVQTSGTSAQNFTSPVTYTVNDFYGSAAASYTVTVTAAERIIATTRSGSFSYKLNFASSPKNVFYIFTNPYPNYELARPQLTLGSGQSGSLFSRSLSGSGSGGDRTVAPSGPPVSGKPGVTEFNNNPPPFVRDASDASRSLFSGSPPVLKAALDDELSFYIHPGTSTVPATCRGVVENIDTIFGNKSLYIWVEDASWHDGGSGKTYYVDQDMVDAMADKFLNSTGEHIYNWITGIFGEEWGQTNYSNLIQENDEIHILLKDIGNDNEPEGGVLGYFWGWNNYDGTGSNKKIMFYMDSVMFANPEGGSWEINDEWPAIIVSTLAHEFQHMIHFYQKNVLKGVQESETWLNEMCSLMAEDFLADKLGVPGPRGIYPSYGPGDHPETVGRLPLYNYYNDYPLTLWPDQVVWPYSVTYAFGAFLGRNFGGAPLFRHIVQSSGSGADAVEYALGRMGYNLSFADLMIRWGVSVVLSDKTNAPQGMVYNKPDPYYFESSQGGETYKLGSINLYNYRYGSNDGPWFWAAGGDIGFGNRASNAYYRELSVANRTWNFSIPYGYILTLVIADP